MPKQTVTIEVDVPDGWEFERYGQPNAGEHFSFAVNCNELLVAKNNVYDHAFIYRKAWQCPVSLCKGWDWLSMNADGKWYFSRTEPWLADDDVWHSFGGWAEASAFCDFTPPPCTDWRQSKRRRPTS